jgi:hypothetical protein
LIAAVFVIWLIFLVQKFTDPAAWESIPELPYFWALNFVEPFFIVYSAIGLWRDWPLARTITSITSVAIPFFGFVLIVPFLIYDWYCERLKLKRPSLRAG